MGSIYIGLLSSFLPSLDLSEVGLILPTFGYSIINTIGFLGIHNCCVGLIFLAKKIKGLGLIIPIYG